jgi:hypothetical protein
MRGELRPPAATHMQRDDLALALRQPREHGLRHAIDLELVLVIDQLLLGRSRNAGPRQQAQHVRVDRQFSPRTLLAAGQFASRRRTQPRKHLALALPAAGPRGQQARLLHGLLDLLARRAGAPRGNLGAQARARLAARGALDQRSRERSARSVPVDRRHHPYRGAGAQIGPPFLCEPTRSRAPTSTPAVSLRQPRRCAPPSRQHAAPRFPVRDGRRKSG